MCVSTYILIYSTYIHVYMNINIIYNFFLLHLYLFCFRKLLLIYKLYKLYKMFLLTSHDFTVFSLSSKIIDTN